MGFTEASTKRHIHASSARSVDLSRAERKVPEALADNEHVKFGGSVAFGWLSNDFDDAGYIGDPTGANAERGAELFNHAVERIGEQMAEIRNSTLVDDDRYSVVVGSLTLSLQ